MQAATISVGVRAMESRLEFLRTFQIKNLQHILNTQRYLGPAPAAAPATAPASARTLVVRVRNAVRTAPASGRHLRHLSMKQSHHFLPVKNLIPLQEHCQNWRVIAVDIQCKSVPDPEQSNKIVLHDWFVATGVSSSCTWHAQALSLQYRFPTVYTATNLGSCWNVWRPSTVSSRLQRTAAEGAHYGWNH